MKLRHAFLSIMHPIVYVIGKIKLPVRRKWKLENIIALDSQLWSGDVILTRNKCEMTNLFIPGRWKHACIAIEIGGIRFVIEAVDPLVRIVPFDVFCAHHDLVAIYRPTFMHSEEMHKAALKCVRLITRPYDYWFEPGNKRLFCSELVTWSIEQIVGTDLWTQREIASGGITSNTTLPSDFADSKKFKLVTFRRSE